MGSARLDRSQKDGLPSRSRGFMRLKAINSRIGEGSPVAAPSHRHPEKAGAAC